MAVIKKKKKNLYGKKIKEALVTQKKLAELIGMDEVALSNKINGHKEFEVSELLAIEEALNIHLIDIGK